MDRIETMRIFVRVTELASFTAAAEELGLPKASVSTAVRRLEESLGTQLLHRTTRRVRPSQDGSVFYDRCRELLDDLDDLQTLFQADGKALTGRLRVDMPSGLARGFVLPRLPQFLEAHPAIEVELSGTDRRVDPVREGFDCVLRVGEPGDVNLVARRLGELPILNCVSPAYLERYGRPQHLEDLTSHKLIHYVPTLGGRSPGFEYPTAEGYASLPMEGALTVNSAENYEAACLAGLGIIQAPELGMRAHIEAGRLVEVLPELRAEPMPLSILYARRRHLSRRTRAFMDWVESILKPYVQSSVRP